MSSITNYSVASRLYEYNAKLIRAAKISNVQDQVSIGMAASVSSFAQTEEGNHKKRFSDLIKDRLKLIKESESSAERSIESDSNLVQLASSLNEADIVLQEVTEIRNRLVSAFQKLMESSF